MLAWLHRRRAASAALAALIEADAVDLVGRFGDQAYGVARDRDRNECKGVAIDGNRPARHWSAVKRRIASLTGTEIGVDTATRYPGDRRP